MSEVIWNIFWTYQSVARAATLRRTVRRARLRLYWYTLHLHARTCCSPITTLCRSISVWRGGGVRVLPSALQLSSLWGRRQRLEQDAWKTANVSLVPHATERPNIRSPCSGRKCLACNYCPPVNLASPRTVATRSALAVIAASAAPLNDVPKHVADISGDRHAIVVTASHCSVRVAHLSRPPHSYLSK